LEGEGLLSLGDEVYQLHPGIAVVIPSQLPHGVQNPNATPLRYLDLFMARSP
jgi:mannose-6-phosphate isomerase-like protein (cupin superfamily)